MSRLLNRSAFLCVALLLVIGSLVHWFVSAPIRTTAAVTAEAQDVGGDPPADWNNPFVDGVRLTGVAAAAAHLRFIPAAPASVGVPRDVFIHAGAPNRAAQALGLVYDGVPYGRFIVQEEPTRMTQEQLESLAKPCESAGCQGSWTVTTLGDGTRVLLIASSVSDGVLWLRDGVLFNVYGPSATFAVTDAEAVATAFSRESN